MPAAAVRAVAFAALAAFGVLHWATLLVDPPRGALLAAVALAVAAAPLRGRHVLASVGLAIAALPATLLLAGVPLADLDPRNWGTLVADLADATAALPGSRVPYDGPDADLRHAMAAGAVALVLLAAVPALHPRRPRPVPAAVLLAVLWAVPVVEQDPGRPYLDGAAFALLLAALLFGDRLTRRDLPVAAPLLALCVVLGAALGPRVDAERPLLDYEQVAEDLDEASTSVFEWGHAYGPIDWTREGREVLRVRSSRRTYWKAAALEAFDGLTWQRRPQSRELAFDTEISDEDWRQRLQVRIGALRTTEVVSAGSTLVVRRSPRAVAEATPGTFRTITRPLRRDDTYVTEAYVPRPTQAQMRAAGTDWPDFTLRQLEVRLPLARPDGSFRPSPDRRGRIDLEGSAVLLPPWGSPEPARSVRAGGFQADGAQVLRDSPYARAYDLALRLKAASSDPYDFVRRVQRRVREGATYSETPRPSRLPLDTFLFDDRAGYCQHFSGAMALLLRLGGVPARVASGFAPGDRDAKTGEWVVRDLDAHSWVEAYFPGIGWVTFDPTPGDAPTRGRPTDAGQDDAAAAADPGDTRADDPVGRGRIDDLASPGPVEADEPGAGRPWLLALAAGAVAVVLLAAALLRRRAVRRREAGLPAELEELRRALARTGRATGSGLTLAAVEGRLRGPAAAYVGTLRTARFGPPGAAPDARALARGRAALRRALGDGLGPSGRLRALRALPPTWAELRARLRR